jgi:hypothetical protein
LQRPLCFFFGEEPLYRSPLSLIDRGFQQMLKPLDVGVYGIGEVIHLAASTIMAQPKQSQPNGL